MEKNETIIIADSSGLISLAIENDNKHQHALDIVGKIPSENFLVIVPSEVISETLNILGKKVGHKEAVSAIEIILESSSFLIVPASDVARSNAINIFRSIVASVSYTDCLIMAIAHEYNTKIIFGFDEVFRQKGFTLP